MPHPRVPILGWRLGFSKKSLQDLEGKVFSFQELEESFKGFIISNFQEKIQAFKRRFQEEFKKFKKNFQRVQELEEE